MKNDNTTPVKVSVLKTIFKALKPIKYRLDAMLEDYHKQNITGGVYSTSRISFRSCNCRTLIYRLL